MFGDEGGADAIVPSVQQHPPPQEASAVEPPPQEASAVEPPPPQEASVVEMVEAPPPQEASVVESVEASGVEMVEAPPPQEASVVESVEASPEAPPPQEARDCDYSPSTPLSPTSPAGSPEFDFEHLFASPPKELPETVGEPPSNEGLAAIEQQEVPNSEELPGAASSSKKRPLQPEPLAEASPAPSNEVLAEGPTIEQAPSLQAMPNSEELPAATSSSKKRPLEQEPEAEASQLAASGSAGPPAASLNAPELPEQPSSSRGARASGIRGPNVFSSPAALISISPPGCTIRLNRFLALHINVSGCSFRSNIL